MKLKTYVFKANEHFDYSDFLKKGILETITNDGTIFDNYIKNEMLLIEPEGYNFHYIR